MQRTSLQRARCQADHTSPAPHLRHPARDLPASCPAAAPHHASDAMPCSSTSQQASEASSRRSLLLQGGLLTSVLTLARPADASERGLARYIRKKRLDPLDTYVPVVLVAREQLVEAGMVMIAEPGKARDLLRQGAFDGLRESIRALGSYAETNNPGTQSAPLVQGFFRCLEDYDLVLAVALRESQPVPESEAKEALDATVGALDALLATVPADILEKSKQVVAVTKAKEAAADTDTPQQDTATEPVPVELAAS